MLKGLLFKQIKRPSGLFGRYVVPLMWNKRNRVLNNATLRHLQPQPDDRILEIGFGGGYLLSRLIKQTPKGLIAGIDKSDVVLSYCRAKFSRAIRTGKLELQQAGVNKLPYPDQHFSKICSVNSLFFWPNLHEGICEIFRVLTPDGLIVFTYTTKEELDRKRFPPEVIHPYTDGEVIETLRTESFVDVSLEHHHDHSKHFSLVSGRKDKTI